MKTSIKITALLLLASTGIFASASAKTIGGPATKASVTIAAMPSQKGLSVSLDDHSTGKSVVTFFDQDKNVLRKDVLNSTGTTSKAYVLGALENGDYTMEVTSNRQTVVKNIHVYNEGQTKTFIVQD